jgi:hypothetical protein
MVVTASNYTSDYVSNSLVIMSVRERKGRKKREEKREEKREKRERREKREEIGKKKVR